MINLFNIILPIACLSAGFCYGFKIGKDLEIPKLSNKLKHPIKAIKEEREREKEDEKLNIAIKNLENYDGDQCSQEDI